jgi:hypothetical protein
MPATANPSRITKHYHLNRKLRGAQDFLAGATWTWPDRVIFDQPTRGPRSA